MMKTLLNCTLLLLGLLCAARAQNSSDIVAPYELGWKNASALAFLVSPNGTAAASVGALNATGELELYSTNGTVLLRSDAESVRLSVRAGCLYLNDTLLACAASSPTPEGGGNNELTEKSFETLKTAMIAAGVGSLCMIMGCVVGMFAMKKRMQVDSYHSVEEIRQ